MATANKDIELFIFNYNGARFVKPCIAAVRRQTMQPARIFFIDNGSTDDSVKIAKKEGLAVIANPKNMGIAYAQHQAMDLCTKKYAAFLHIDVIPSPTWLENLYRTVEKEKAAAVEAEVVHPNGQVLHGHLTRFFANEPTGCVRYPNNISSCSTLYRSGLLKVYFPPKYFHYYEDVYCAQALLRAGHRIVHEKRAVVKHYGSYAERSSLKKKIWFRYLSKRNRLLNILHFGRAIENPYAKKS